MKNNYMNKSNVLLGRKLACFALAGTVAVSSLAVLTPSAGALILKNADGEVTVTTVQEVATAKKIVNGNTVEISAEEAALRAASWYNLDCDGYTNKTLYVPIGGTVQNGSTYEENGYLRATEGSTIFNRYGVDVTSVDSQMSDYEKEIAKTIHDNLDSTQVTFDQQRQMAAEMRLLEVKQIMADIKAAGYEEQMKADYNTGYGGKSVYDILLMGRPDMSAKLLEMSKTAKSYGALMAEFKVYRFTEYYNTGLRVGVYGINVLPYTAAGTAEYEYFRTDSAVYEYKGGGQGTSTAHEVVVHFDHTPTLEEIAGKVYSGLGGADHSGGTRYQTAYRSAIGISYDAETNTVVAICG